METLKLQPHIEKILQERYYLKSESSWSQMTERLSVLDSKMHEYILNRVFIPSTPTLMNLNTKGERNGTLSSCFILDIEDSIEDIMNSMKDTAFVTKAAGGVGFNFSKLRGSNENVKTISANSGGVMAFIQIFDSVLDGIRQGGKRRGAGMSMLSCVSGETLISTLNGKIKIKDLVGKFPIVYCTDLKGNIKIQKSNKVWKTGKLKTIKIKFDNDSHLQCTPDHKILLSNYTYKNAGDLVLGDSVSVLHKRIYFRKGQQKNRAEYVLDITKGNSIKEHIAVSEYKYGNISNTILNDNNGFDDDSEIIHHIDGNSLNNDPDNLEKMTYKGRENLAKIKKGKTWEEFYGIEKSEEIKNKLREKRKNQIVRNAGFLGEDYKRHYKDGFKNQFSNHKVICIEEGDEIDVYDISVPEYNNFVANDVFVHNCYHPDILQFIDAKVEDTTKYTRSNFSVWVDSAFYKVLKQSPNKVFKVRNVVDGQENELKDNSGQLYTYKMLWDKIIHNAWKRAEPGIFNGEIAADRCTCKHITRNIFSNPCSEYVHIPYTSCNLASFNLHKFIKDNEFDWKSFEVAVDESVVYMNGVIDNNRYPIEKIRKETLNVRPIGLGIMGFAHLLYELRIPFDSLTAANLAEKICRFQTLVAMRKSVEMAKEYKKKYPYFDYDIFMDASKRFFVEKEFMGIDVEKLASDIKKYGIYNSCLTSIAPTGCIEENTRIITNAGLIKIKDIVAEHPREKEFNYNVPEMLVASEDAENKLSAFFNNGETNGYSIRLEDGRRIKTSSTHRIRILKDGKYSWEFSPDIKVGDIVVLSQNSSTETSEELELDCSNASNHFNSSDNILPSKLNEKFAEWMGIFTGDGSTKFRSENGKIDGIRFPADSKDYDFALYIQTLTKNLFGIDSYISKAKNKNMYEISIHSINIGNFLVKNGLAKKDNISSVKEKSDHIYHVPELIFRSPKKVICAYLRGLFETDGSISNGSITFSSKFEHITLEVQELLTYLGIRSSIRKLIKGTGGFNDVMFSLRIDYKASNLAFRDKIGFLSDRKKKLLADFKYTIDFEKIYLTYDESIRCRSEIKTKLSSKHSLYQKFNGNICRNHCNDLVWFNRDILNEALEYVNLDFPFELHKMFHLKVADVVREKIKTFDIEINNEDHTYLTSNGIINHNTISYIADCSSSGEPVFGLVFTRKIEKENKTYEKVYLVDPVFKKFVEINYKENAEKIYDYVSDHAGSCQGCEYLTKAEQGVFKVAGDITPEWHLKVLAAMANNISLSVSKCVAKGTKILTNKGIINIEDLGVARGDDKFDRSLDVKVKDMNGDWKQVTKHYSGGIKPTKIIRFNNGNIIEFANTHKLLTNDGWTPVDNLNVNDYVYCRSSKYETNNEGHLPISTDFEDNTNSNLIFLPIKMDSDLALFLGMIASDGHLVEITGNVGITTADDEVEKVFSELCKKIFKVKMVNVQYDKRTKNTRSVYITSRKLCRYIVNLLDGHNCISKKVPSQIINGSELEKISFINGLTLDGYIAGNKLMVYQGYSKHLVDSVFQMCCELGLKPRKSDAFVKTGRLSNWTYGVDVDYHCFKPIELHKNKILEYSNIIPVPEKLKKLSYKNLDRKYYGSLRTLRRNKYRSMRSNNSLLELCDWDKNLYLLKIVSIENSSNEVYDIEVEDTHNYLIDNIISHNTINLPKDCKEEEISNVFIKAHELGVIGVTVYRDGSREGVLVHKEELKAETYVQRHDAPKRPELLPCDIHEMAVVINGKKERFVALVGKLAGTVYEIFVTKDIENKLDFEKHKTGFIKKVNKGKYDLLTVNGEEKICLEDIGIIFGGQMGTLSRLVSMSLRHGTPLQIVADQLSKENSVGFLDFERCVARVLKHYIKEGEKVITSEVCQQCGSKLIYIEGCKTCSNKECGWSKCN
jgi:ribonucleotide reductase alpha subunit